MAALPLLLLLATVLALDEVVRCGDPVSKTPTAAAPTIKTATMVSRNADVRFVLMSGPLKGVKLCVALLALQQAVPTQTRTNSSAWSPVLQFRRRPGV
jgi:hypothetical protein